MARQNIWNHMCARVSLLVLIYVNGKDTNQTSWMRRLICVFTVFIILL